MNLLILPYFAAIWAFGAHVGAISSPWTIGWILLWLIFSPIACWSGVYIFGGALRFAQVSLLTLIVAAFFSADARIILATLVVTWLLGSVPWLWLPIAVFVEIVGGIWVWYHGGIGL